MKAVLNRPAGSPPFLRRVVPFKKYRMSTLSSPSESLIYSDLGGPYVYQGQENEIIIYRLPASDWVVEISTGQQRNIVLDDLFSSEESAYAAALDAIHDGLMDL